MQREDMIPVLLSPLMGGRMAIKDRILQGIYYVKNEEGKLPEIEIGKNCWYIPILFATIGEKICSDFFLTIQKV